MLKHEHNTILKGDRWVLYWRQRQQLNARLRRVRWPRYAGTRGVTEVRQQTFSTTDAEAAKGPDAA